jgi:hypothetical protein
MPPDALRRHALVMLAATRVAEEVVRVVAATAVVATAARVVTATAVVATAAVRGVVEKEAAATVVAVLLRSARRLQSARSQATSPRQSRRGSSTVGWSW